MTPHTPQWEETIDLWAIQIPEITPLVAEQMKSFIRTLLVQQKQEVVGKLEGLKIDMEMTQNQIASIMLGQEYEVVGWNKALTDAITRIQEGV